MGEIARARFFGSDLEVLVIMLVDGEELVVVSLSQVLGRRLRFFFM